MAKGSPFSPCSPNVRFLYEQVDPIRLFHIGKLSTSTQFRTLLQAGGVREAMLGMGEPWL